MKNSDRKENDVVVVGNVGIDTNVYFYGEPRFDVESNYTTNIDYVGQAGGYSARGFAQLGYKTAFIGYVGDDFSGDYSDVSLNATASIWTGFLSI